MLHYIAFVIINSRTSEALVGQRQGSPKIVGPQNHLSLRSLVPFFRYWGVSCFWYKIFGDIELVV